MSIRKFQVTDMPFHIRRRTDTSNLFHIWPRTVLLMEWSTAFSPALAPLSGGAVKPPGAPYASPAPSHIAGSMQSSPAPAPSGASDGFGAWIGVVVSCGGAALFCLILLCASGCQARSQRPRPPRLPPVVKPRTSSLWTRLRSPLPAEADLETGQATI